MVIFDIKRRPLAEQALVRSPLTLTDGFPQLRGMLPAKIPYPVAYLPPAWAFYWRPTTPETGLWAARHFRIPEGKGQILTRAEIKEEPRPSLVTHGKEFACQCRKHRFSSSSLGRSHVPLEQ